MKTFTALCHPLFALSLVACSFAAKAQTPQARIHSLSITGATRGTTTEITLQGAHIAKTTSVLFEGDGITVESITRSKDRQDIAVAKLKIAPNAAMGRHLFRVLTEEGASQLRSFFVDAYPEVAEKEPNNTRAKAQEVAALPATLIGKIEGAEDVDAFRFHAAKGRTYVFEVIAARIDSALDSVLSVQDAQGHELAINEDYFGADSALAFTAPADGDYVVLLRDIRYQASGNHFYRLQMGEIPLITEFFPMGLQRGTTATLQKRGYNLGADVSQSISAPANATAELWKTAISLPNGATTLASLSLGNLQEVTEQEPNNTARDSQSVRTNWVVNGRIDSGSASPSPDIDCFRFTGKRGQAIHFDIFAKRIGSRLSPTLSILNRKGDEIASDEAQNRNLDTQLSFSPPADEEYIVQVSDLFRKQGQGYAYRLVIQETAPDFRLSFTPDIVRVGVGGRATVTVTATRLFGFQDEIGLELFGLPEGVQCLSPKRIPAGRNEAHLVLAAPAGTRLQGGLFSIEGTAKLGKRSQRRLAKAHIVTQQENNITQTPTEMPVVSVTPAPEFVLQVGSGTEISIGKGETKEIALKFERKAGFNAKIPVSLLGVPAGVTVALMPPEIGEKQTDGKFTLKAEGNAPIGEFWIVAQGRVTMDSPYPLYFASAPIRVTLR